MEMCFGFLREVQEGHLYQKHQEVLVHPANMNKHTRYLILWRKTETISLMFWFFLMQEGILRAKGTHNRTRYSTQPLRTTLPRRSLRPHGSGLSDRPLSSSFSLSNISPQNNGHSLYSSTNGRTIQNVRAVGH